MAELRLGIGLGIIEHIPLISLNRLDANIGSQSAATQWQTAVGRGDQVRRDDRDELLGASVEQKAVFDLMIIMAVLRTPHQDDNR